MGRRAVEDAMYRPQESGPHLVHKAHDDTGRWEVIVNKLLCTPGPEYKQSTESVPTRSTRCKRKRQQKWSTLSLSLRTQREMTVYKLRKEASQKPNPLVPFQTLEL